MSDRQDEKHQERAKAWCKAMRLSEKYNAPSLEAQFREVEREAQRSQSVLLGESRSRMLAALGAAHVDAALAKLREIVQAGDALRETCFTEMCGALAQGLDVRWRKDDLAAYDKATEGFER